MTAKDQLLQEIDHASEPLLEQVLDFLLFLKSKHQPQTEQSGATANSRLTEDLFLRHFGTWEGDDIKDCLRSAVEMRTDISELEQGTLS